MTFITYAVGSKASTRYTATVNGSPLPLWGRTVDTQFPNPYWAAGDLVPQSWATIASDQSITIVVSLVGGPVTSARVYTNNPNSPSLACIVSGGTASFVLPADALAWVEINGVRGQPLLIASRPILPTPTGPSVDTWNGTQTRAVAGRTLVFPPGVHTIGQSFQVDPGGSVFFHGEAWVVGSLRLMTNAGGSPVSGHGVLSGEWADSATKALIRNLPFEIATTYSLIYGEFFLSADSTVSGITLVDPPFYSTAYGSNIYDRVTIVAPWWANANAFFPAEHWPSRIARVSRCLAFVHDDVFDFSEYLGRHRVEDNLVGSVAAASFIAGYWPARDGYTAHTAASNVLVCLNLAINDSGGIITAWCDGGSAAAGDDGDESFHVTSDITWDGLHFAGPAINGVPFDIRNKPYPVEWGGPGPGDGVGQIRRLFFRNITFETTPTVRSLIHGKDRLNTPHDISFENVFYAGVRLTVANFATYFDVNEFPYNIFVDGVAWRPSTTSSGSWYASDPQFAPFSYQPLQGRLNDGRTHDGPQVWFPQGAIAPSRGPYRNVTQPANWATSDVRLVCLMTGSSTSVATPTARVALRMVAQGVSSMVAGLSVRQGLSSVMQAGSTMFANPTKTSSLGLSAAMTSSSSFQATLGSRVSLACVMVGGSSMAADPTPPGSIDLGCVMQAGSTLSCPVGVITSPSSLQQFDPMKQRVYNTLLALCNAGPFHEAKVDVKTGQMTVFTSKTIKPVSVDVREITKQYQPASRYRRAFNVAEIASWVFEVELRFASGVRASCEVFEQTVADAGITVPPAKGIAASRSLLARLTDSKYDEPPAQNPSLGSVVLFTFEVVPETLRS